MPGGAGRVSRATPIVIPWANGRNCSSFSARSAAVGGSAIQRASAAGRNAYTPRCCQYVAPAPPSLLLAGRAHSATTLLSPT